MSNFLEDIEDVLKVIGEDVERIVIGNFGSYYLEDDKYIPKELTARPVDWEAVKEYLDYEYDDGYGGAECHAFYAYTKSQIIYVSEYDGSTSIKCIPRNPIECSPRYL